MEGEQETVRVLSRFKSETGEEVSSLLDLPLDVTADKLQLICNALLKQVSLKCINLLSSAVLLLPKDHVASI
jgi:NLE (NUC135) domain.